MNDRELLDLAAKAMGINPDSWEHCGWQPLNIDTGDALQLAVKLRLEIYIHENDTQCIGPNLHRTIETHKDDAYAATCRAIVRAAAEIGKQIK
jgi:hypothetical protein